MTIETPVSQTAQAVHVQVRPWPDPVVEAHGFSPLSAYVEYCWLPVLGPTATWLYRRLGSLVVVHEEGWTVDLVDLAVSIGLGEGLGRHSIMVRALTRLQRFEVLQAHPAALLVRRALGPLPEAQARRLSFTARRAHQQAIERRRATRT